MKCKVRSKQAKYHICFFTEIQKGGRERHVQRAGSKEGKLEDDGKTERGPG